MKQENKLNKALKDALHGQAEPLQEAQWERLSAALGEEKPKRKFFPWFIMFSAIVVVSMAAGYWLGRSADQKEEIAVQANTQNTEKRNESAKPTDIENTKGGENNSTSGISGNNSGSVNAPANNNNDANTRNADNTAQSSGNDEGGERGYARDRSGSLAGSGLKDTSRKTNPGNGETGSGNENELSFKLPPMQLKYIRVPRIHDSLPLRIVMNERIKRPEIHKNADQGTVKSRRAFSFSSGYSPVSFKISAVRNDEKLHKDSRTIFEQSNRNSRSWFANAGFEWKPFRNRNFIFATGLQFRQIVQDVNFRYDLTEIPLRDSTDAILGYIPGGIPITFEYTSKNYLSFLNIPLKAGFAFPIGKKNELQLTGGLNIAAIVGANGKTFSISEYEFKSLRESYKKPVSVGVIGGLGFSRNIYKAWWLGAEAQWQQNTLNYDAHYGIIRSRINVSSYNLQFRYKF
jgi:hypothetical protein